jgi:GNAT superfamily N-acetyltransferase
VIDLAVFDNQLRESFAETVIEGERLERIGPLICVVGGAGRGFVGYRDLAGIEGTELDALIARCIFLYAERQECFEWKLYEHDRPPDLARRLEAAGFVAEKRETVEIALAASIARAPECPDGVALREVSERSDLDLIARFEGAISGDDRNWLADMLEGEQAADPESLRIVVVETGAEIVSAGWVRFVLGTDFASLWGGSTLPAWRRRGIYRALVAYRASLAVTRGYRYLQVDASEESGPILERLGFVPVTTTTPYIWSPPG